MNAHSEARRHLIEECIDPLAPVWRDLDNDAEAVALARIVQIAQPFALSAKPLNYALADCWALAGDALDDLIFETAQRHGFERDELPSRSEIVEVMLRGVGVTASPGGRSAALRAEPASQSQAEPAATNAGVGQ